MEDASIPKGTVPEGRTEEPWAVSHSSSFFDLISSLQITNYYCSVSACPGTKESLHCARLYMKSICCTWFKQGTIWAACQRECGKWLLGRTSSVAVGCVKHGPERSSFLNQSVLDVSVKSSKNRLTGFKSQLYHSLTGCLWTSDLTSLPNSILPNAKIKIIITYHSMLG